MEDIFKSGLLAFTLICALALASANSDEVDFTSEESYQRKIEQVLVADDAAQQEKDKLINKESFHTPL